MKSIHVCDVKKTEKVFHLCFSGLDHGRLFNASFFLQHCEAALSILHDMLFQTLCAYVDPLFHEMPVKTVLTNTFHLSSHMHVCQHMLALSCVPYVHYAL